MKSECGRFARCYPVQKPCSGANVGICLCVEGFQQSPIISRSLLIVASNQSVMINQNEDDPDVWTDCVAIAHLGQRCTIGPYGSMTYDAKKMLVLPKGAVCDVKSARVRCSVDTVEFGNSCIEHLGTRTLGQRCGERISSTTACDSSKGLNCLPAVPYRRCQCPLGYKWHENSTQCKPVAIGQNCFHSFECNIAQFRAHHYLPNVGKRSSGLNVAYCEANENKCRCNETAGFVTASIVVPNVNVSVKKGGPRNHENMLLRVDLNFRSSDVYGQSVATKFVTESRCIPNAVVSRIAECGESCELDLDSATDLYPVAVCAKGLTCHHCPLLSRAICVKITQRDQSSNDDSSQINMFNIETSDLNSLRVDDCSFVFGSQPVFAWLSLCIAVLVITFVMAVVIYCVVKRRQLAIQRQRSAAEERQAASMALLDSSTSQVPQVWATFKITPWRT